MSSSTNVAVLPRLIPALSTALLSQLLGAAISIPRETDKYYDLSGTLGFVSTALVSLFYPCIRAQFGQKEFFGQSPGWTTHAPRQLLLTGITVIWAIRLGSFLYGRVKREGRDFRFDKIKHKPLIFSAYWFGQAVWIASVGLPVWIVNALPTSAHPPLGARDYFSLAFIATSLALEVLADMQKDTWRIARNKGEHDEKFITKGLWGWSRHPNYVGEIGIWFGVYGLASRSLQSSAFPRGALLVGLISPLFSWAILRNFSGVPPLERANDARHGDDPAYQEYKKTVPILFPWARHVKKAAEDARKAAEEELQAIRDSKVVKDIKDSKATKDVTESKVTKDAKATATNAKESVQAKAPK